MVLPPSTRITRPHVNCDLSPPIYTLSLARHSPSAASPLFSPRPRPRPSLLPPTILTLLIEWFAPSPTHLSNACPGVLEYGEVFVQVQPPWAPQEAGAQIIDQSIVVYRSPGMHPGGVRLLTAVNKPELAHHVNCIVFPGCGPRPHAAEMSSGDLDGDKYLIIWEPSIVSAVRPMDPEPRAANTPHHKKSWVRHMPKKSCGPIVPPEHELATQVAHEDRLRQRQPHVPTLGDHMGHAPPRRKLMKAGEIEAEGKVVEAVREAKMEEERQRFESELMALKSSYRSNYDAAVEQHEREQEERAVKFYLFFGQRHNVGQISNMWLAYADKYGVEHNDTLELCRMAQLAVQFVKTGEPVWLDRQRFTLAIRPDYMNHGKGKNAASYKSNSALGKLYRAAIATPEGRAGGGGIPQHSQVCMKSPVGYEAFLPDAVCAREAYESEIRWLLQTYGVKTEAELLSGRVASFDQELVKHSNPRDNEESLRRSMHELWSVTRQRFCESVDRAVSGGGGGGGGEHGSLRLLVSQQLAYAWYIAGYRLDGTGSSAPLAADATVDGILQFACPLTSFAWVAWPELLGLLTQRPAQAAIAMEEWARKDTIYNSGPDLDLSDDT